MSTTPSREKPFASDTSFKIPKPFIFRRLHSLMGLWLALYLFQHLLINSRAAFFFQDDGSGYIKMVNQIHNLPYLRVIEIVFLGLPFLIHMGWGIVYLKTGKSNSMRTDGKNPALPQYVRNRAYTWQRITSWVLLVGVIAHVIHMRFVDTPHLSYRGNERSYAVKLQSDNALIGIAKKLHATLYTESELGEKKRDLENKQAELSKTEAKNKEYFELQEEIEEDEEWLANATKRKLKPGEIIADTPSAGVAFLLIVRETFKSPLMVVLYSLFVVAAAYHGYNGLWTFLITWGVTLTRNSQSFMRKVAKGLILLVTLMGLLAIWGTYYSVEWQKAKYGERN